jgi:small subunit ribosomal protein S2
MPREVAELLAWSLRHLTPPMEPKMHLYFHGAQRIHVMKKQTLLGKPAPASLLPATSGALIGTKKQAKDLLREEAVRCAQFYVTERWLGGSLTNFTTIRKSVKRLTNIEKMESDGTFDKITKKEGLFLQREKDKLNNVLSGVVDMTRLPGRFVVDVKRKHRSEARRPASRFAIVDTNCDPSCGLRRPRNDDAIVDSIVAGLLPTRTGRQGAPPRDRWK